MLFNVAEVFVTTEAGSVTTTGAFGSVLNVASRPLLVPPALVAAILKWYSVFAVRPAVGAETAIGVVPVPAGSDEHAAVEP